MKSNKKNPKNPKVFSADLKIAVAKDAASFRGKRGKAFKALKTGMTVANAKAAIDKVFGYAAGSIVLRAMATTGAIQVRS